MTASGNEESRETAAPGRREANKRATREAIRAAADKLIARQGFEATSVRQIAEAADVTERTFYRYFDGKEALLAEELNEWMEQVRAAIVARPEAEPPAEALRRGLLDVARQLSGSSRAQLQWLFADEPRALKLMRRAGTRPLLRLEGLIVEALLERTRTGPRTAEPDLDRFTVELLARTAVAILRSVAAEGRRLGQTTAQAPPPGELLTRGFLELAALLSPSSS